MHPSQGPKPPARFAPEFASSSASLCCRFACLENRSGTASSDSPILPSYCLFLLENENWLECLRREDYLGNGTEQASAVKNRTQFMISKSDPALPLRADLARKIASLIGNEENRMTEIPGV